MPSREKAVFHRTDDDSVLLVRQPLEPHHTGTIAARLPPSHPPRICVPMLMRPWALHTCHATASCHLGVSRAVSMLMRVCFGRTGKGISDRWWIRRCLKCQAYQMKLLLRGTTVNRTYGTHKTLYISIFLLLITIFGPIFTTVPRITCKKKNDSELEKRKPLMMMFTGEQESWAGRRRL